MSYQRVEREGEPVEGQIFGGFGRFVGAGDDWFWASCVWEGQRARWRTESEKCRERGQTERRKMEPRLSLIHI